IFIIAAVNHIKEHTGVLFIEHAPADLINDQAGRLYQPVDDSPPYYAPWGDVVMFYDDFGGAEGLYELGEVVSGAEYISEISGSIQVEQES
ncbi:cyclophilin-like fold protein, partial [Sellimonas sp.]|uniref:cyclophilin-like fold protein n=1 Tax=Sellimonas sp. TaxID=2021466 RepID=UPI00257F29BD